VKIENGFSEMSQHVIGTVLRVTAMLTSPELLTAVFCVQMLIIALPGAVMFFASGAIMMEAWHNNVTQAGEVLASGILAFLNGLVYLVDFALTYFKYR
jgi:hypothetical protein